MTRERTLITLDQAKDMAAIKPTDAFALLGISKNAGWQAIHEGRIPSVRLGPKTVRVPVPELLRLVGAE